VQGIIKQVAQESEEKLKTHITAQTTNEILVHEVQAKENIATTKDTFENLVAKMKGVQQRK